MGTSSVHNTPAGYCQSQVIPHTRPYSAHNLINPLGYHRESLFPIERVWIISIVITTYLTLLTIYSSTCAISPEALVVLAGAIIISALGLASSWLLKLAVRPTERILGASASYDGLVVSGVCNRPRWTAER